MKSIPLAQTLGRFTLVEAIGMALSLLLPFDGRDQYCMPTTGGLGVNTGIPDSFDLAWKLDGVLSGWGGESLLDTYDPERRAAVTRSASLASSIYQDWVETRLHIPHRSATTTPNPRSTPSWRRVRP